MESCRAIVFDFESKTVCLVHYYHTSDEWLLVKGRRNYGESRQEAALCECGEETRFRAQLYPVNMHTRAPPQHEKGHVQDKPRCYSGMNKPFMATMRHLEDTDIKII